MWKTIVRRFLILIPQLLILSLLIFLLAQYMPGDALRGIITPDTSPDQVRYLRELHGLDDPWFVQYTRWLRAIVFEFDFGMSVSHSRPVLDVIGERMMNTIRLSALTTLFTYMLAIPLGILAGRKHDSLIDRGIMVYTFIALSMPTVVLSIINLLIFGFNLGWFPVTGSVNPTAAAGTFAFFLSRMHHLLLPAITLALISTTSIIYYLRSEIIDFETSDFVLTARSKGVPENKIYTGHILRNAFLPIASSVGFVVAALFTGSVFIETTFSYPGMGQLFINSITGRDFPVANVLIMFYAVLTVISITLSDIIITVIDPRIRIK
jgi:peptide/nickel transport system permease protein